LGVFGISITFACNLFFIARSKHPDVFEYIIEAADVLRNVDKNIDEIQNKYILQLLKSWDLEKKDLSKFKNRTATATSKCITRSKFPNPGTKFGLGDIDSLTIRNIICEFHFMYFNHQMISLLHGFNKISQSNRCIIEHQITQSNGKLFCSDQVYTKNEIDDSLQ
jgi:hypothetical protein